MRIDKNAQWIKFEDLFTDDYLDRWDWFLFEFGKRITKAVHVELLGRIKKIKGTKDYRKRLIVAEIRDQGNRSWWAVAAKARALTQQEHDAKRTAFTVVPRYKLGKEDPINEILVKFGPWSIRTLPFMPSLRQAVVVSKKVSEKRLLEIEAKNRKEEEAIGHLLKAHKISVDPRIRLYEKLKVVPDWEVEALRLEFGLTEGAKAHWRPTLKWVKNKGIQKILSEGDLFRALTDPNFQGYVKKTHLKDHMTLYEVIALEKFQKMIRTQLG